MCNLKIAREYLPPWSPEKLVGALQDNIHREIPDYRIPRSVKVDVPMKELTSSLDVELKELFSCLIENGVLSADDSN